MIGHPYCSTVKTRLDAGLSRRDRKLVKAGSGESHKLSMVSIRQKKISTTNSYKSNLFLISKK